MRTIAIASSKGGVGKTTAAINLGCALKQRGIPAIVIDCNLTNPNIAFYLGTLNPQGTLHGVLQDKHDLQSALHLHESGLTVIPGDASLESSVHTDVDKLFNLQEEINNLEGIKLLDCGSGITKESMTPLALADHAIIVTTPELPAIMDAKKTIQSAQKLGTNVCGIILNRVKDNPQAYARRVRDLLGKPIIGIIPEDGAVRESQQAKHPVVHSHPSSKSSDAFKKTASKLL